MGGVPLPGYTHRDSLYTPIEEIETMRNLLILFVCLLALGAVGCADPTKDKPKAAVDEPRPEPEQSADARRFVIVSEESAIGFVGSKVTGSHDGGFRVFEGEILVVGNDPLQSSVNVEIDVNSMWTDTEKLTEHLKSPDFFEVETYPTASFASTQVQQVEDGYRLVGNMTMHGITKSISIPAEIRIEEDRVTASSEFAIRRFEFDIEYPGRPDDLIRDDVLINLNLVAVPAEAEG
jgi:polyisoprenoid-binding protein YceI